MFWTFVPDSCYFSSFFDINCHFLLFFDNSCYCSLFFDNSYHCLLFFDNSCHCSLFFNDSCYSYCSGFYCSPDTYIRLSIDARSSQLLTSDFSLLQCFSPLSWVAHFWHICASSVFLLITFNQNKFVKIILSKWFWHSKWVCCLLGVLGISKSKRLYIWQYFPEIPVNIFYVTRCQESC